MSRAERDVGLQELCPVMPSIPGKWAAAILLMTVKDLIADLPNDNLLAHAQRWAEMIYPGPAGPGAIDKQRVREWILY